MSRDIRVDTLASESMVVTDSTLVKEGAGGLNFNKIINVKFIRKSKENNGKRYFTIRSDYEPVFNKDGTTYLTKCKQKPSIYLKYQQLSNKTSIGIEIRVDALFVDREAAGEEIDSSSGNPVTWAVVQLGYFDEFPRWDKLSSDDDLNRFFSLDNNSITTDRETMTGKQILVQILYCYPEGIPPNREWVFVGTVASFEKALTWNHSELDISSAFNNPNFPRGLSKIEAMFYQFITRRFVRAGVEHRVNVAEETLEDGTVESKTELFVTAYDAYFGRSNPSDEDTKVELDRDGLMRPVDADMFGVRCVCSEVLRNVKDGDLANVGLYGPAAEAAMEDTPVDFSLFNDQQDQLSSQIIAIVNQYQFIRYYYAPSGNYYFYHVNEKPEDLFKDPTILRRQESNTIRLPAVYDITMSGMRMIRCPFTKLIDPMTTVLFQSRYRLVDMTGYYTQPKRGYDAFLVLLCSVEFSTNGDENMMTLTCEDIPEEYAPDVDFSLGAVKPKGVLKGAEKNYTTAVGDKVNKQRLSWSRVKIKIGTYPYDRAQLGWLDLARTLVECANPDDWGGVTPTIYQALDSLKDWNLDGVWSASRMTSANGYSPENKLVPSYGSQIPWLYNDDVVELRQPFRQEYDPGYELEETKVYG